MGGMAAQMVALTAPKLVRKLVLAGTTASAPDPKVSDLTGVVWPRDEAPREAIRVLASADGGKLEEVEEALRVSFFPDTEVGGREAKGYWDRVMAGTGGKEVELLRFVDSKTGAVRQRTAAQDWKEPNARNSYDRLRELGMPVLVMNGDDDVLIPTSRSWELVMKIPDAQLIIYPKAGHGFLYQYAQLVAGHVNEFLDGGCEVAIQSKI